MSQAVLHHGEQNSETPFGVSPTKFGMWLFLVSEVMFFTGMLGSYIVLRFSQPEVFSASAAQLSWPIAALNTVILITSSYTMALAVIAAQKNDVARTKRMVGVTLLLGIVFLAVKAFEYNGKFQHGIYPATDLFFAAYFTLTGCHALHIIGGLIAMLKVCVSAHFGRVNGEGVELLGLYWHFVDLVWIFLFPLLYLL